MKLSPAAQRFILHWGEMGGKWGVNRTVAQIHALLLTSPRPIHAEEISSTLSIARSNVSAGLKELQAWKIVKLVHVYGDRRDHFECLQDIWEMFRAIGEERKKKELDPTLEMLRTCAEELRNSEADDYLRQRILQLLDFFKTLASAHDEIKQMSTTTATRLLKLGKKIRRLLGSHLK